MSRWLNRAGTVALAAALAACGIEGADEGAGTNPFLEDLHGEGKEDSAYFNPDGIEVEVDFEADVQASSWRIFDAPADLGQFAVTYLRKSGTLYIESLAEAASSDERVEWLVGEEWMTAEAARDVPAEELRRFRIRGMNAVLLFGAADGAQEGQVFEAEVPLDPYSVMTDANDTCASYNSHIDLSQSVYWYLWNPDRTGCELPTQQATLTISKMFRSQEETFPEYDRLVEDGRLTTVVVFGKIGDELSEHDTGMRNFRRMADWLVDADFEEVDTDVGRRFRKDVAGVEVEFDLYSPYEFSGLSDHANFDNFQRAIWEHEIVVYDGHSMLGASDFWSRPNYPDFYQIFVYGGCLGYQYYVQPILEGKGGWDNVDIVSSVIEVSVGANDFAGPLLARVLWALDNDFDASWVDILQDTRRRVGDSTFGVSGVTDNCFTPQGSRCEEPPVDEPTEPTPE